jgi:hypothetical protein
MLRNIDLGPDDSEPEMAQRALHKCEIVDSANGSAGGGDAAVAGENAPDTRRGR